MSNQSDSAPTVPSAPKPANVAGSAAKPIPLRHENEAVTTQPQPTAPAARAATADEVEVARTNPDPAQVKHTGRK